MKLCEWFIKNLAVLGVFLPSSLLLSVKRKLTEYKFPVYKTEFCPRNNSEWNQRSSAFNCTEGHSYACFPNDNITVLLEFCYPLPLIAITADVCLFLSLRRSELDSIDCRRFKYGCPKEPYIGSNIFSYPSCVSIGKGCFTAEPDCKGTTDSPDQGESINQGSTQNHQIWIFASFALLFIISVLFAVVYLVYSKRENCSTEDAEADEVLLPDSNERTNKSEKGSYCCPKTKTFIKLIKGDLGHQKGDVIACSVGKDLNLSRGKSSKSLLKSGNKKIATEIKKKYPNGIDHGEIATIKAGKRNCKFQELYLGCLQPWGDSSGGEDLVDFMTICLETASRSSYSSIVFPAMGTGYLGYPKDQVAAMMYKTVIEYAQKSETTIKEVIFVCYSGDLETIKAFEEEEKHRRNPRLSKDLGKDPVKTKFGMTISIEQNEIGKHKADVVVAACQKSLELKESGNSAKSLYRNGGDELQDEAKKKYPKGIENYGDFANIPGRGKLNCQEVFLTCMPYLGEESETMLSGFLTQCMKKAEEKKYTSIGFAAIGSGLLRYPLKMIAKTMYDSVIDYSNSNPNCSIKNVSFVIYPSDTKTIKEFEQYAKKLWKKFT